GNEYLPIVALDDNCFVFPSATYPVEQFTGSALIFGAQPSLLFVTPTYSTNSWYFQFGGGAFSTLGALYYPSTASYDVTYTADLPNAYGAPNGYIQYSHLANGLFTETEAGPRLAFFTSARAVAYRVEALGAAQLAADRPFLTAGRTDLAGRNYGLVSTEP